MDIPSIYTRLGNRLRSMREARGMNKEDAALKLQVSRSAIKSMEAGTQRIQLHYLPQFAALYCTTVDEILRGIW